MNFCAITAHVLHTASGFQETRWLEKKNLQGFSRCVPSPVISGVITAPINDLIDGSHEAYFTLLMGVISPHF